MVCPACLTAAAIANAPTILAGNSPPLLYWSWLMLLIIYPNMSVAQLNHQTSPEVLTCSASFAGVAAAAAAARAASSKAPAPKAVLKQARVVRLSFVLLLPRVIA